MTSANFFPLLFLLAGVVCPRAAYTQPTGFRFLATGDVPYSNSQEVEYRKLLNQASQEDFAFLMHVGDIKSGETPCTDQEFVKIRDLFHQHPTPVVYTLGDNEWTDCVGVGEDPLERLAKLRELFFHDESVLRLDRLDVQHQSQQTDFAHYVENYWFEKDNVLFVVTHVCGSENNRRADDEPSMREFTERNRANLAFLDECFALARAKDVAGVAIVIHANPDFEGARQEGFRDVIHAIRGFLDQYNKPVLCIHGDSHYFRIDKPLKNPDTGRTYLHFTRMEVFGSPNVAGVEVSVDAATPEVFSFKPYYVK